MAADMEFRIENLDFEVALYNKSSERFQQLGSEIQDKVCEKKCIYKNKSV